MSYLVENEQPTRGEIKFLSFTETERDFIEQTIELVVERGPSSFQLSNKSHLEKSEFACESMVCV